MFSLSKQVCKSTDTLLLCLHPLPQPSVTYMQSVHAVWLCSNTSQTSSKFSTSQEASIRSGLCKFLPSHLQPFVSEIIERVVARRFNAHIFNSHLLPIQQPAYRPFHFSKTSVLSVHNYLVRAINNSQGSLLFY